MPKTGSEVDQKNPDPNSAFRTDFEPFTGSVWPPEQRRMKRRGKRILRPFKKKSGKKRKAGWSRVEVGKMLYAKTLRSPLPPKDGFSPTSKGMNLHPSSHLISVNDPAPQQRHIGKFAQINLATKEGLVF